MWPPWSKKCDQFYSKEVLHFCAVNVSEAKRLLNPVMESVIDLTQESLDPDVFDEQSSVLKEDARSYILGLAAQYSLYGQIAEVYIVGSILSFQWTPRSDVDVNLGIVPIDDDSLEHASKKAASEVDRAALPGTRHPVNFYVVKAGSFDYSKADGIYDVVENKWIKGPYNISVDAQRYMDSFRALIRDVDLTRAELYRDLVDFERLISFPNRDLRHLQTLIADKLKEIDEGAGELIGTYDVVHAFRKVGFEKDMTPEQAHEYFSKNQLPPNIIYKLLERYQYNRLLTAIRRIVKEAGGTIDTPEEAEELAKVFGVEESRKGEEDSIGEMTSTASVASVERPIGMNRVYRKKYPLERKRRRKRRKREQSST